MQTLTVCGGTLFDIASRYLGSAENWDQLATINKINDPWLSGVVTLIIPDQSNGVKLVGF